MHADGRQLRSLSPFVDVQACHCTEGLETIFYEFVIFLKDESHVSLSCHLLTCVRLYLFCLHKYSRVT